MPKKETKPEEKPRETTVEFLASLAAVLVTVIVLRPVWVFPFKWLQHRFQSGEGKFHPTAAAVISWAGMRGVVTLAAAFVIPDDAPHREVLLLVAFTVVVGILVLLGSLYGIYKASSGAKTHLLVDVFGYFETVAAPPPPPAPRRALPSRSP